MVMRQSRGGDHQPDDRARRGRVYRGYLPGQTGR